MNMIELTNEEYNAIIESREYLEEKSNFDKYLDNKSKSSKNHKNLSKAYANVADTTDNKNVADKLRKKSKEESEKADEADTIRHDDYRYNYSAAKAKEFKGESGYHGDAKKYRKTAREIYKRDSDQGKRPEEKLKKNRYLELYKAKKAAES